MSMTKAEVHRAMVKKVEAQIKLVETNVHMKELHNAVDSEDYFNKVMEIIPEPERDLFVKKIAKLEALYKMRAYLKRCNASNNYKADE